MTNKDRLAGLRNILRPIPSEIYKKIMTENMKTEFETLGDVCKAAEDVETMRRAKPSEVIIVRLDGHGFSKFTKGLGRPYDVRLSNFMIDAVKHVVNETQAVVGYTQSDEITLVFKADSDTNEQYYFGGRFQKLNWLLHVHHPSLPFSTSILPHVYLKNQTIIQSLMDVHGLLQVI